MSSTLRFKEWLRTMEADSPSSERERRREEWMAAFGRLRDDIRRWLQEDGEGLIEVGDRWVERRDRGLGIYSMPALRIVVGDQAAEVVPVARNVIGVFRSPGGAEVRASGRADLTDGVQKVALYRLIHDGKDAWYIVDDGSNAVPLTRESFEKALMDLML
jgi:hypothetical protein